MRRLALVVALAFLPGVLAAQSDARSVPISWWGSGIVDHLARAGVISSDPVTRPWTRESLVEALAMSDTSGLVPVARRLISRFRAELEPRTAAPRLSAEAGLAIAAASDAARSPLDGLPRDAAALPAMDASLALDLPHLALVTHPRADRRLLRDPYSPARSGTLRGVISDEAYVGARWRHVSASFGVQPRNFGPYEADGLMLSVRPEPLDHLFVSVGPSRLRLEMLTAQLEDLPSIDSTRVARRMFALHRLVMRPHSRLAVALSEVALYATSGGDSRGFEPWYLNPVNLWFLAQSNGAETANLGFGLDVAWRASRGTELFFQGFLDDLRDEAVERAQGEPPGHAGTVGVRGGSADARWSWWTLYSWITNAAYRTPAYEEQYSFRRRGLGRDRSDTDEATLKLQRLGPWPGLVGLELTRQRRGAGDFRQAFPPVSAYADSLTFLTGVVESTWRVALSFDLFLGSAVRASGEVALHRSSNANHVPEASRTAWVWRLRVETRARWSRSITW
ncbi:MAG TPA: hypothetical protein VNL98_13595 [Gemmatimonadales bacterium]|nr:hypothetical protein [Gemmatimonadales bacterium]